MDPRPCNIPGIFRLVLLCVFIGGTAGCPDRREEATPPSEPSGAAGLKQEVPSTEPAGGPELDSPGAEQEQGEVKELVAPEPSAEESFQDETDRPDKMEDRIFPADALKIAEKITVIKDFEEGELTDLFEAKNIDCAVVPVSFDGARSIRIESTKKGKKGTKREYSGIALSLSTADFGEHKSINFVLKGEIPSRHLVIGLTGERRYTHIVSSAIAPDSWQILRIDLCTFFLPEDPSVLLERPVTEEMQLLEVNLEMEVQEPGDKLAFWVDKIYLGR